MTTPAGWHPDPSDPNQIRYWDGQQWTGRTQPRPQPAGPQQSTPQPPKKSNAWKVIAAVVAVFAVISVIGNAIGGDEEEESTAAPTTTERTTAAPAPRTTTNAPAPRPTTTAATTTRAPETARAPAPAASATEAGCEEADPSIVAAIEGSIGSGFTLTNVAAVTTQVDDIEYTYTAGDVYEGESRKYSMVVWITPGFGVFGLSSNAERASDLPDGGFLDDAYAGDDYSVQAMDCVMALALGRN